MYAENESLIFLDKLLGKKEDLFIQDLKSFDEQMYHTLFESMQNVKADHKALRDLVFKLKRIIKATAGMTTSLVLNESIERIVEEICETLDCERATIFLYDQNKEELWSKVAKGSEEVIRIPTNIGVAGNFG